MRGRCSICAAHFPPPCLRGTSYRELKCPLSFTMAGLDPATQRARACGRKRLIGSRTLACWMAGPACLARESKKVGAQGAP